LPPVHLPRPPAFGHGTVSFLWAVALGLYVWAFCLAVGVGMGEAVVWGLVTAFTVFFAVLVLGATAVRKR
jgi:hypothetical protein